MINVDPQGLEPRITEPKSGVLPITPWVSISTMQRYNFFLYYQKVRHFFLFYFRNLLNIKQIIFNVNFIFRAFAIFSVYLDITKNEIYESKYHQRIF